MANNFVYPGFIVTRKLNSADQVSNKKGAALKIKPLISKPRPNSYKYISARVGFSGLVGNTRALNGNSSTLH